MTKEEFQRLQLVATALENYDESMTEIEDVLNLGYKSNESLGIKISIGEREIYIGHDELSANGIFGELLQKIYDTMSDDCHQLQREVDKA